MHTITSQDFNGVRAGWTHEQTYTYLNVDRRTYERWLSGRSRIPFMAYELLRIINAGELSAMDPDWHGWQGWRVRHGKLISPEGDTHTPGQIRAWHWVRQALQELRARENRLAHTVATAANVTPLPGSQPANALTQTLYRRLNDAE